MRPSKIMLPIKVSGWLSMSGLKASETDCNKKHVSFKNHAFSRNLFTVVQPRRVKKNTKKLSNVRPQKQTVIRNSFKIPFVFTIIPAAQV